MTIEYHSSRGDVLAAYVHTWRHSLRMRLNQVLLVLLVLVAASSVLRASGESYRTTIVRSSLWAAAVLAVLVLYPQLMFKSKRRQLTIGPEGIHTSIGTLKGDIPWSQVISIATVGDRTYVIRKNLNSLIVPSRAFSSVEQRTEFIRSAETWWKGSSGPRTA